MQIKRFCSTGWEPKTRGEQMGAKRRIPKEIWVLGFVSLLMDVSSEMVHSLLPVFLVSVIGASVWVVGLIEGVAESAALIVKIFSGARPSPYLRWQAWPKRFLRPVSSIESEKASGGRHAMP
jgi:hypothetical protein